MSRFIERCGAVNPADGSLCQRPKGHAGNHRAADDVQQSAPTPTQAPIYYPQPRRGNTTALGCLGIIALILFVSMCSHLVNGSSSNSGGNYTTAGHETPSPLFHKAVGSARDAARIAGLSEGERVQYSAGLTHIKSVHAKLGSFTISQVIALGATPAPTATPDPYIADGDPPCLKLESQHGNNDSFAIHISGTVVNTCDRSFSYVQITFRVEDSSGAVVGNAMGNALNIDPGQAWHYEAIGSAPQGGSTFNMTELTGH